MGRKRINRTEEEIKKLRQQYYQYHREEILRKAREKRETYNTPKTIKTESAFQSLLNEWNEQLSHKLQENVSQWLKIALEEQITLNKAMLTNQDEEKDNGLLLPTQGIN